MMKKTLLIGLTALFLISCGNSPETNTALANANSNPIASGESNVTPANTNVSVNSNVNVNTNAANKAIDNTPKRVSFTKGANWGSVNVTLAPNAAQLFVVSAKSGQIMEVESSSKDIAINLRKGKAETTEDFGFLNAELRSNGDFVFEVKNTTKKEVKSSIKVTINDETLQRGTLNDIDEENEKKNKDN